MQPKKPVIGIILDYLTDNEHNKYAPRPWYALRQDYSLAVSQFGGMPIYIGYEDALASFDILDGLVIAGGDFDIDPAEYGENISHPRVILNQTRSAFEKTMLAMAVKDNMPVFGICNGMQLINIYFGGSLYQHLPEDFGTEINHEQPPPKTKPTHDIIMQEGTKLFKLGGNQLRFKVNTTHHQGVKAVGQGLNISAKTEDGLVEAIEHPAYRLLVGAQWHAEYLNCQLDNRIFERLIETALEYKYYKTNN